MAEDKREDKRVSILTLSYNSPDLYAAIDSVLMQTYGNIQFVIVDDCSENFSKESVSAYISDKNRGNVTAEIIVNSQNCGIIRSSNIGIGVSDGEYIINLAGDDAFYDENVVADIVNEFENTGAMIITGLRSVRDSELNTEFDISPSRFQAEKIRTLSPKALFEEMVGYNFVFGCCTARSRECIEKYGLYDEKYFLLDDYSMNMKLLRNGVRFHFFERLFIKYRSNGISSATNVNEKYIKEADLMFKNEIEPYSSNPAEARKKYERWKKNAAVFKEYISKKEQCSNNLTSMFLKLRYCCMHPSLGFSFFKAKMDIVRGNKWKLKQ